jgi:hypothetical protein
VTTHLAIVLPGGNNDPWTPPVLLPSLALEEAGASVERISYKTPARGLGLDDSAEFNAAVVTQVTEAMDRHQPDTVTFVAKSRGTLFLAAMDTSVVTCDVNAMWITTPLIGLDYVREGIVDKAWRSMLVAGSADPYHDPVVHDEICAELDAVGLVIPGGNHGLVVDGDVLATVDGYRQLAEASLSFARAVG